MPVRVELYLMNGHCIETAAREELQRMMRLILNSESGDEGIRSRYELLLELINTADFIRLRASDERLTGSVPSRCEIYRDKDQKIRVRVISSSSI